MRGDHHQLVVRVRGGRFRDGRLHQPLRHEIRIPPVGRRGMRVIVRGQTEVSLVVGGTRLVHHIFPRTEQLHDAEREVGKTQRIRLPPHREKI